MRKKLIAGNWKMNKTSIEAAELIADIKEAVAETTEVEVVVAPPFTALDSVKTAIGSAPIGLSAQNLFWEEEGAFTGEISPVMLTEVGCQWAIIGHSERRQYFGETNETVNKRTKTALKFGIKPIICVGETLEEREGEKTKARIEEQLAGALTGIGHKNFNHIALAYEPVWAIGTGKTATPEQAQEVHAFIRDWLRSSYNDEVADETRILYGGSVKPGNAGELLGQADIDGALVGGASLNADDFNGIIRASF